VAGSPQTVAQALMQQARDGKLNYLMNQFMSGDMPHADAMRSVELYGKQVMPIISEACAQWL
jgi:alkanesulfonate monooxygenase SsuD/methylene tetrahydromethanopterin reductase-like flavin-dependent oxidoreductase (luciferase family)